MAVAPNAAVVVSGVVRVPVLARVPRVRAVVVSGAVTVPVLARVLPARAAVVSGAVRARVLAHVLAVRAAASGTVRVLVPAVRVAVASEAVTARDLVLGPPTPVRMLRAAKTPVLSVRARRPEVVLSDATTLAADAGTAVGLPRVADAGSPIAVAGSPASATAVVPPTVAASRSNAEAGRTRSPVPDESPARPYPRT
jgi:hypothetical protein